MVLQAVPSGHLQSTGALLGCCQCLPLEQCCSTGQLTGMWRGVPSWRKSCLLNKKPAMLPGKQCESNEHIIHPQLRCVLWSLPGDMGAACGPGSVHRTVVNTLSIAQRRRQFNPFPRVLLCLLTWNTLSNKTWVRSRPGGFGVIGFW